MKSVSAFVAEWQATTMFQSIDQSITFNLLAGAALSSSNRWNREGPQTSGDITDSDPPVKSIARPASKQKNLLAKPPPSPNTAKFKATRHKLRRATSALSIG